MNKERRNRIAEIMDKLNEIADEICEVAQEERDLLTISRSHCSTVSAARQWKPQRMSWRMFRAKCRNWRAALRNLSIREHCPERKPSVFCVPGVQLLRQGGSK